MFKGLEVGPAERCQEQERPWRPSDALSEARRGLLLQALEAAGKFPDFILDATKGGRHLPPFMVAKEAQRRPESHPRPRSRPVLSRGRLVAGSHSPPFLRKLTRAGRGQSSASRPRARTGPLWAPPSSEGDAAGGGPWARRPDCLGGGGS